MPSANVGWVDGLDSAEPEQQSATPAQQETEEENDESSEVIENYGGPGVSRTRDLRFRKPLLYPSELRGHKRLLLLRLVYDRWRENRCSWRTLSAQFGFECIHGAHSISIHGADVMSLGGRYVLVTQDALPRRFRFDAKPLL